MALAAVCDDVTYDRLPSLPRHLFTGDFGWRLTDGYYYLYLAADGQCPVMTWSRDNPDQLKLW